jgi:thiol-disulfide isomerase/thioredoxin
MIDRRTLLLLPLALAAPAEAAEPVASEPRVVDVTVRDRDGRERRFTDLRGRVTLLHFWASWCASCRTEFPALDALQRDLRTDGLGVVAVSLDRMGWPAIDRTVAALGIHEVMLALDDDRAASRSLGVVGLPTTLLVDRDGREVARWIGSGDWDDPALRDRLRSMAG